MLFWVTIRGRERTFSNPRDSAMVRIMSIRILWVALMNDRPLLGPVTPRFENNGIVVPLEGVPLTMYNGLFTYGPTMIGEAPVPPAPGAPPTALVHGCFADHRRSIRKQSVVHRQRHAFE